MLALIGGTGFEEEGIITDAEEIEIETPWGKPAAPLVVNFQRFSTPYPEAA